MSRKKTHEEYVAELAIKNPNIEVAEKYINSQTKILHRCLIDGYEWYIAPSIALQGHGCPVCNGGIKQTHEQYVEKLKAKNQSVVVIGHYVNSATKIMHRCLKCGYEWLLSPANSLGGKGCPVCAGTIHKTHEQYVDELKIKNPNIIAVGKYVNRQTKIKHRCLIHDYEWETSPAAVLYGCGCPMCKSERIKSKLTMSHDEYVNAVAAINKDIIVMGRYINARTPIRHKCLVDGWEWDVTPDNILRGHGCPQCSTCTKSTGEKTITDWLDNYDIAYEKQKTFEGCKDKYVLRFDFYLPDYDIAIEYNGKQHYEPIDYFGGEATFRMQQHHDEIKRDYCTKNNMLLFEIPYFKDIDEELKDLYDLIQTQNNMVGGVR